MDNRRTANGTIFISGELLTGKEALKMGANLDALERIELSQRKTYWFFGARFAMNELLTTKNERLWKQQKTE